VRATILISSYCRPDYLRWGLTSLLKHKDSWPCSCNVLVLNDGIQDTTEEVAKSFDVDYLFTGQRNKNNLVWRCPGFAFNIGIQQSQSEIIVLSCAEMYHMNDTLSLVLPPVLKNNQKLGTPKVYDDHGPLLQFLSQESDLTLKESLQSVKEAIKIRCLRSDPFIANAYMPYFLAVSRQRLLDIGGYDEDFIGKGADDNDLMDRLLLSGCEYVHTDGEVVHVNHGYPIVEDVKKDPRYIHNVNLWKKRAGVIQRNVGRSWGLLEK